jgi:hypothetical protein
MLDSGLYSVITGTPAREATGLERLEEKKGRRRPLTWPRQLNDELESFWGEWQSWLGDPVRTAEHLRGKEIAVCFDMKQSFQQVELGEDVRRYFAIRLDEGRFITSNRLPMGFKPAADIMETILRILVGTTVDGVKVATHVDNVRFVSADRVKLLQAADQFRENCRLAGVTLNDEPDLNRPHEGGDFLGMRCDYRAGRVSMTEAYRAKIVHARRELAKPTITIDCLRELVGKLMYVTRIHRIPVAQYYWAVKFFRRAVARLSRAECTPQTSIPMWKSAQRQFAVWCSDVLHAKPVAHPCRTDVDADLVLVTDASTTGYGGVLFDQRTSEVLQVAGKWQGAKKHTHINELEADALAIAIRDPAIARRMVTATKMLILVDNTSTAATVAMGSAHAFLLNQAVNRAVGKLPEHLDVRIGWIPSEENVADVASRGGKLDLMQLASALGPLGRRGRAARLVRCCGPAGLSTT